MKLLMEDDAIDVYYGPIHEHSNVGGTEWELLSIAEQDRALAMGNPVIRQRFISVHASVRRLLAAYLDIPPTALHIAKAEFGKPFLPDFPDLAFNLSHTTDRMALAVTRNCRIGIDIEAPKSRPTLASLAAKCFGQEELDYWRQLPAERQCPEFYRFWTCKEAFVKATGKGIALGLENCVIDLPSQPYKMLRVPSEYAPAEQWQLFNLDLGEQWLGAVAVDSPTKQRLNLLDLAAS